MTKLDTLRAKVLAAEKVDGVDRLRALANVREEAKRLEDDHLLELVGSGQSGHSLAREVGITAAAMYERIHGARRRRDERARS